MPRHLISDAHEWINEIPSVPHEIHGRFQHNIHDGTVSGPWNLALGPSDTTPWSLLLLKREDLARVRAIIGCDAYSKSEMKRALKKKKEKKKKKTIGGRRMQTFYRDLRKGDWRRVTSLSAGNIFRSSTDALWKRTA